MILVFVCDGLRPDLVNEQRTPFIESLKNKGAWCEASHCVFPSATRINSSSLATGCYPMRHGVVDNELYVPQIDESKPISCADWRYLRQMADIEGGRLLTAPTIGERLASAGRKMASAGSGSPGTTYLTNPEVTGPIVNWALAWPEATEEQLADRYGGMLTEASSSTQRNRFVIDALKEQIIPDHQPDLLTVWFTEPDHMQHGYGLASPQADALLTEVDGLIQELVNHCQSRASEPLTVFVTSDHGFSTVDGARDPEEALREAGWNLPGRLPEIVRTSNSYYLCGKALDHVSELVDWLAAQPWTGAIMLRDDLLAAYPQAMPQSATYSLHDRSAEIMIGYRWSEQANAWGIPGSVHHPAPIAAIHGSASPYAMRNTLLAWGEGVCGGTVSRTPCGIVDIAPTILYLLGVNQTTGMDGRVLVELLGDGPELAQDVASSSRAWTYGRGDSAHRQTAHYSHVGRHHYLDRIDWL